LFLEKQQQQLELLIGSWTWKPTNTRKPQKRKQTPKTKNQKNKLFETIVRKSLVCLVFVFWLFCLFVCFGLFGLFGLFVLFGLFGFVGLLWRPLPAPRATTGRRLQARPEGRIVCVCVRVFARASATENGDSACTARGWQQSKETWISHAVS
jgi:fatty acid desaturase